MQPHLGAVSEEALFTAGKIELHQRRGVAAECAQEKGRVLTGDDERPCRQAVGLTVAQKALPARRRAPQQLAAAVLERAQRESRPQLQILEVACESVFIAFHALARARNDVNLKEIVPLGIAVIEANESDARPLGR